MTSYRQYVRSAVIVLVGVVVGLKFGFFYTAPFLILAAFFYFVDVRIIDKASVVPSINDPVMLGTIADFIVDSTKLYGMYIELNGQPVFIDIKQDDLIEGRKEFAKLLLQECSELDRNLKSFLEKTPEFREKNIAYIGLHSKELDRGEVFWRPNGYTLLKGTQFLSG